MSRCSPCLWSYCQDWSHRNGFSIDPIQHSPGLCLRRSLSWAVLTCSIPFSKEFCGAFSILWKFLKIFHHALLYLQLEMFGVLQEQIFSFIRNHWDLCNSASWHHTTESCKNSWQKSQWIASIYKSHQPAISIKIGNSWSSCYKFSRHLYSALLFALVFSVCQIFLPTWVSSKLTRWLKVRLRRISRGWVSKAPALRSSQDLSHIP